MKRLIKIQHAYKWKKKNNNYNNDTIDVGWITGKWFKTMWDFLTAYKIFKNTDNNYFENIYIHL